MDYKKLLEKYRKRREEVKRLLDSGLTAIEVARRMRISRQRVYQILK